MYLCVCLCVDVWLAVTSCIWMNQRNEWMLSRSKISLAIGMLVCGVILIREIIFSLPCIFLAPDGHPIDNDYDQ